MSSASTTRHDARPRRMGWPKTLGLLASGRNINPETLLATDYLNHFNEIVMLIDMVADMPDCIEDIQAWEPLSYCSHFARSHFADKDLAILAYENAPTRHREPFDIVVAQANRVAGEAAIALAAAISEDAPNKVATLCTRYAGTLRRLIDMASGIINGNGLRMDQREIDAILAQ